MFSAWVADQELESIKRRTRDGLERARRAGEGPGASPEGRPTGSWRRCGRMRDEGLPASGGSPATSNAHQSTVLRDLRRQGSAP